MSMFEEPKDFVPVKIPMRDGATLLGDLYVPQYLPDGTGPYPTLVRMTPYPRRRRGLHSEIQYAVAHGYAVLIVSQRGRFGSDRHPDGHEGPVTGVDGYDTIEWAAEQKWSTGRVGTFGISSDGQWQLFAAVEQPPHLSAAFVSYPANAGDGRIENGVYTSTGVGWHALNDAFSRPLMNLEDWQEWLGDWQKSELPMLTSLIHPTLLSQFTHPPDDPYWTSTDPSNNFDRVNVPVLLECGWFDRYVRWTLQIFSDLRTKGQEKARPHHRLLLGPWLHGGTVPPSPAPAIFAPEASIDRRALHVRWFDQWLKDEDTGVVDDAPVRIYVMGSHKWITAETWPLPGINAKRLFLRTGDGSKTDSLNDGQLLVDAAPSGEEPDSFEHNPYDPVPTIGGHGGFGRWWGGGPLDQRPSEKRCLTYSTQVLDEDLTVIGAIRASIHASSTAQDTDFVLTISDVYPDGYSAILRQTPMSGRYRRKGHDQPLKGGEPFHFEVEFPAIANVFKAGHRLRLTIASSSFPAFLPNPGTGEPPHLAAKAVRAMNQIFHGPDSPSFLELPVLG